MLASSVTSSSIVLDADGLQIPRDVLMTPAHVPHRCEHAMACRSQGLGAVVAEAVRRTRNKNNL